MRRRRWRRAPIAIATAVLRKASCTVSADSRSGWRYHLHPGAAGSVRRWIALQLRWQTWGSPLDEAWRGNYRRCGSAFTGPGPGPGGSGVKALRLRTGMPVQKLSEGVRAQRRTEQEALDLIAAVSVQEIVLRFGFHAFGDNFEFHVVRHRNDAARYRRVVAIVRQVADK